MSGMELLGAWVSIALTLMLLSFLYDDNPVYKLAEHLFLGISVGVATTEVYFGNLKKDLVDNLISLVSGGPAHLVVYLIPLTLVALLFAKLDRKRAHLARIPIAVLVAAYAGVKLTGEANANLMEQMASSMPDLRRVWAENLSVGSTTEIRNYALGQGWTVESVAGTCRDATTWAQGWWCWSNDGAGILSSVFLVVGLVCCLVYFYFSVEQKGVIRYAARGGTWVLMLGFGASFGYTVMGRISLAIGRGEELLGVGLSERELAAVHPRLFTVVFTVLMILFLVIWRRRRGSGGPHESDPLST